MPLPAYRDRHYQHRDRSRLGLLLSRQQRKTLLGLIASCVVYSYAFFGWQPDRSFESVHTLNEKYKHRAKLRQEQKRLARKSGGRAPPLLLDEDEDGPEWQRKIRASAGGIMAWRREQEALNGGFGEDEEEDLFYDGSYLRGDSDVESPSGRAGADFHSTDGEENTAEETSRNRKRRRRKRQPPNPLFDFIIFMSVFAMTRSVLRVCLYYRHFNRVLRSPSTTATATTNTNTNRATSSNINNNDSAITTRNNSLENPGRSALARLMVPQSIHAHATLLRHARFRAWVTDLNRERAQHGQPPLSLESLRLVMRDSDFSGNDYEALMQFHEEATIAHSMGATQTEIDRYPERILLDPHDDLLESSEHQQRINQQYPHSRNNIGQECSICLEAYQINDRVRRIPCMHQFHVDCIDPWLAQRAVCPICKHPVVG